MTEKMPNPQAWNALQAHILTRMARGEPASFDRWNRLTISSKPVTSGSSTTPFTLFRRGHIISDGERVTITESGRAFVTETIGVVI